MENSWEYLEHFAQRYSQWAEEKERSAERLRPILDDYVKDMKSKGMPGDEGLKYCLGYLKAQSRLLNGDRF